MIVEETFQFLNDLAANNNREWFNENKAAFKNAQDNVTAFVGSLIGEVSKFDRDVAGIDPASCVFRIYRDVRFSKDKSPYKTNLGAYLAPGGRKSMQPGYYIHFEPGACFVAGGKHMPDGPELLKVRNAIANETDKFLEIVESRQFKKRFGALHGDALKKPPKGFDPEHEAIEYLKLKEFMAHTRLTDDEVLSPKFPKKLAAILEEMYPLVAFLRKTLG